MYYQAMGSLKTYELAYSTILHPYKKVIPIEYIIEALNGYVSGFSVKIERKHDIVYEKDDIPLNNFLNEVVLRRSYSNRLNHQLGFIEAFERLYDLSDSLSTNTNRLKILIAEFERIKEHLVWFYELFYNSGIIFYNRILPYINKIELILEQFFNIKNNSLANCLRIGRVEITFSQEKSERLLSLLNQFLDGFSHLRYNIINNFKLRDFLFSVGTMDSAIAEKTGTVGPIARASAVDQDLRVDDPYWDYLSFGDFKVSQSYDQDLYGLVKVLLTEIEVSFQLIQNILKEPFRIEHENVLDEIDSSLVGQVSVRLETSKGPTIYTVSCIENLVVNGYGLATPGMTNLHSLETRLKKAPIEHISRIIHAYNITELSFMKS